MLSKLIVNIRLSESPVEAGVIVIGGLILLAALIVTATLWVPVWIIGWTARKLSGDHQ